MGAVMTSVQLYHGDCLEVMQGIPEVEVVMAVAFLFSYGMIGRGR